MSAGPARGRKVSVESDNVDADRLTPVTESSADHPRPVLVVDFGAQYAQLIARRVREARIYSEVIAHDAPLDEFLAKDPAAIILSGGPSSVYADDAPSIDPQLFDQGIPVFGICYGFQKMTAALGGTVAKTGVSEFGRTMMDVADTGGVLHHGLTDSHPYLFRYWAVLIICAGVG